MFDEAGTYPVPEYWDLVKDILSETYGAIVYQEQTMLIMNKLAGWSLGKADKMRKVRDLEEYREEFLEDCSNNGIETALATAVYNRFDLGYTFNKSHAAAYAVNSMKTVYCKTYYFAEFMASVMTIELGSTDPQIHSMVKECISNGCTIFPPDINLSTDKFYSDERGIRFPITLIKGVGDAAITEILSKRPFNNLEDLMSRVSKSKCKINQVKNLIKAGCFDSTTSLSRSVLLNSVDKTITETWCNEFARAYEKETLGFNLTYNRLNAHHDIGWDNMENGDTIAIPCIIDEIKEIKDRNNKEMCFLKIETPSEFINGVMFSRKFAIYKRNMHEGLYCMLHGKKDNNSMIVETISAL